MIPALRALLAAAAGLSLAASQTGASRFALAQILDQNGKAVVDIGPDDFVVQEAGAAREILDVRVADYPVAIVLDNSAVAREDFDSLRGAVARFVDRIGTRPIIVVASGDADRLAATFEDDRTAIVTKLDAVAPAEGGGQLLRAMSLAARTIADTGALFSAIVVAAASPADAASDGDPLVAPIIDSRAAVHVVHDLHGGAANPGQQQLLRRVAEETHGGYTPIYAAASYQPALDRLASRLTTEMLIEYLVPVGSKAADVKIGVRIPGARVRGLGVAPR